MRKIVRCVSTIEMGILIEAISNNRASRLPAASHRARWKQFSFIRTRESTSLCIYIYIYIYMPNTTNTLCKLQSFLRLAKATEQLYRDCRVEVAQWKEIRWNLCCVQTVWKNLRYICIYKRARVWRAGWNSDGVGGFDLFRVHSLNSPSGEARVAKKMKNISAKIEEEFL